MNTDDFRYMWRGKPLQPLTKQEAPLLAPIDIRGKGNDRAILLLHGFSSSPAVYRQLLPALTPAYDAIVSPTLPGHGDSIAAFSRATAFDWIAAAEEACRLLVKDYKRVDVLGFSLGGLLACHLSSRISLHHLYLLAPALVLALNIPWALKIAHTMHWLGFQHMRNRAGNLHSRLHSEIAYRQLPITAVIEILTLVNKFQFTPPTCPTDVFLGCFDETINSIAVEKHFSNMPNATIHWLKKSAHVLPLDGDVDAIIACIHKNLSIDTD